MEAERIALGRESFEIAVSSSTMEALSTSSSDSSAPIGMHVLRLFESRRIGSLQTPRPFESGDTVRDRVSVGISCVLVGYRNYVVTPQASHFVLRWTEALSGDLVQALGFQHGIVRNPCTAGQDMRAEALAAPELSFHAKKIHPMDFSKSSSFVPTPSTEMRNTLPEMHGHLSYRDFKLSAPVNSLLSFWLSTRSRETRSQSK